MLGAPVMLRLALPLFFFAASGCALRSTTPLLEAPPAAGASRVTPAPDTAEAAAAEEGVVAARGSAPPTARSASASRGRSFDLSRTEQAQSDADDAEDATEEGADGEGTGDVGEEEVSLGQEEALAEGPLYTADLSDEELERRWRDDPSSLGSMSVGFVHSGRLVNGKQFPKGEAWLVVQPSLTWATEETVEGLLAAIQKVRAEHPHAPPLRVNQMSGPEGGYLRPHKSHQNGRDVDLGFYYPTVNPVRVREREKHIDVALNWALIRALVTEADVQFILVDRRVQRVIYEHALAIGENKAWLDSIFHAGADSLVRHARRHRDHFHVRFYNARAQELGRRVAPMLALQPEHNVIVHRVRSGDTLGHLAVKYDTTITAIKKASRLRGNFLSIGQRLTIPLRKPCTRCPVPPPMVLPARRLPPALQQASVSPRS